MVIALPVSYPAPYSIAEFVSAFSLTTYTPITAADTEVTELGHFVKPPFVIRS